jgi:adenylate kinase
VNLDLREEVLVDKCLGRRICSKCGDNYNVADIHVAAKDGKSAIVMPPLNPPEKCLQYMERREDDTMETILRRLEVYKASAKPVEEFYQDKGLLLDYEIKGGIPETLPVLMEALKPYSNRLSDMKAETA